MTSIRAIVSQQNVATIGQGRTALEAAKAMTARQIGALPVVNGDRLVGIFTERDLMGRVVSADRDPAATRVGDVMTRDLVLAGPDESYESCLCRMQDAHVRHLVVVDEGRLAGIVSLRDLLTVDASEKAQAIDLLTAYVTS